MSRAPVFTLLLLVCAAGAVAGDRAARAAPAARTGTTGIAALRRAADAAFAGATIQTVPRGDADLRPIVAAHVDARLLTAAARVAGTDLRVTPGDGIARHLGVIEIGYGSLAEAARHPARTGFFADIKIMTPMAVARSGATVAVFYSESGGDPAVRRVLDEAARRFGGS